MYKVFEAFEDGKRFFMFESDDLFTCEVWVANHYDATNALYNGWSRLVIENS